MADRTVTLAAKIIARVESIKYEEGDRVLKGERIIQLENAELVAELASAKALLSEARVTLAHMRKQEERLKKLLKNKSISEDKADEAAFNYAAARERVAVAEANVSKVQALLRETEITAPFAGIIVRKQCEVGQVISPGEPLLVLEDHSTLKFRTSIKEQDVPFIDKGQKVIITIDALNDLQLQAKVSKIIPSGDLSTHEFVVEVNLSPQNNLYPGMFGKAEFSQ